MNMLELARRTCTTEERRDKYQIIHDILRCCSKPIKLTRLIARSNLSNTRAKYYLNLLRQKGLIVEEQTAHGRKYYRFFMITAEGRRVLKLLDELERILT